MSKKKKITMQDIANKLNISKNAVSLALMNKKGVSNATRELVLQCAKELGYSNTNLTELNNNIMVLIPERVMSYEDQDHFQFFHDMLWGLEQKIREEGMNAVVVRIDKETERTLKLPRLLNDIAYRGIILFGIIDYAYAKFIYELDVPLVMLDSYYRDLPCPVVTSSNIEGACEAVNYLIAKGHKEIGFIGPVNLTTSHEERWFGYLTALEQHQLTIRPHLQLTQSESFSNTKAEIELFIAKLSKLNQLPTAFFCGNDRTAYILQDVLLELGVPQQTWPSIIGFDDITSPNSNHLPITTMSVQKEKICEAAAKLLITTSASTFINYRAALRYSIPPILVERQSVMGL
ncbi:LacI family DNA-binding transcriptional regulator [Paenibacillus turicensis]|uniref:LacI family DNA-binding transcriptional regulator n=1 Tax=Paenibacillus turicensis TaxID=160487 RepID=UPI003D2E74B1